MDRKLVKPSLKYEKQLLELRKELLESKSRFQGCTELNKFENIKKWLQILKEYEEGNIKDKVKSTQYIYVEGEKILGFINVRHELNDYLYNFGGNIGYIVSPSERKKGYGSEMLEKVLPKCKEIGLDEVLVTCVDFNPASEKIIRKNGGEYIDTRLCESEGVNLKRFVIKICHKD